MDDLHKIFGELPADPDAMAISKGTSVPSSTRCVSPVETAPYTIEEAIADSIEQLSGQPFPDPFTGDHDIQYWIWTGDRLVPASPEAAERIHQQELLEQEELRRRRESGRAYRQERLDTTRRLARRLVASLQRQVQRWRGVDKKASQRPGLLD